MFQRKSVECRIMFPKLQESAKDPETLSATCQTFDIKKKLQIGETFFVFGK